jgi:hypothetical protein
LEKWATFATVSGGAAAGLTGLLFVAVSIRIDFIAKSQELRNRAAQTLALFVSVLFVAIVLSIPDQSYAALGVELLVVALIIGGSLLVLDRRARVAPSTSGTSTQAVALLLDAMARPPRRALCSGPARRRRARRRSRQCLASADEGHVTTKDAYRSELSGSSMSS